MLDIAVRIAVFVGLTTITILMIRIIVSGRVNRLTRPPGLVAQHKKIARLLLIITALLVVLIEVKVRTNGGVHPVDMLFGIHLFFAICFSLGLLVLNFWLTGEKSLRHATAAYLVTAASVGMLATGFVLIFRL